MKPCSNQRKQIALLALDELEARAAQELRAHLQTCEGCRRYLDEICAVTKKLSSRELTADLETSESFHHRVVARLRAEEKMSARETVKTFLALLNWRVALPVLTVLAVLAAGSQMQHRQSHTVNPPAPAPGPTAAAPDADAGLEPTFANYQAAANRSGLAFDALLNRQAKTPLPPAPVYTASTLTLSRVPD